MAPKVFREFGNQVQREKWPLTFDLEGIDRNHELRKDKLEQQQYEEPMKTASPNNFVSGKVIDLNNPARVAYDPRQHEYPKMLYHQTKKNVAWSAELARIKQHNFLHPDKPELLPEVPALTVTVKSAEEEAQKVKEGFLLRPPVQAEAEPELCSRGCGAAPHRGSCKPVPVTA